MAYQAADESPSDAELVYAARGGDGFALGALLDRHRAALYSHALHILGRREDAADAVQETFVLALARLNQLRDASAAGSWLHTILRSVCLMQVRRLRLTTLLRYFGRGHSYAQIALLCDVPVGTVRSRLHQAKAELGKQLLQQTIGRPRAGAEWAQRLAVAHEALEDGDPEPYVEMFSRDARLRGGGMEVSGSDGIRRVCEQDLADGVRQRLLHVVTSAGITVVEKEFVNPPDDPDHCPPGVTDVLFHHGGEVVRHARAYFEPRTDNLA